MCVETRKGECVNVRTGLYNGRGGRKLSGWKRVVQKGNQMVFRCWLASWPRLQAYICIKLHSTSPQK